MPTVKNLIGEKFGRLLVVESAPPHVNKNGVKSTMWKCICDCGNECVTYACSLKSGKTKSCGCAQKEFIASLGHAGRLDLTGQQFERLTVISRVSNIISKTNGKSETRWKCVCDCGNECIVRTSALTSGGTKSCGCYQKECAINANTTHGGSRSRLYAIWQAMNDRCYNSNNKNYDCYGGRGISVCEDWKSDFFNFQAWAIEHNYDEKAVRGKCTIDRIDVNGNYCPENCRWVDMHIQNSNKRNSTTKKGG